MFRSHLLLKTKTGSSRKEKVGVNHLESFYTEMAQKTLSHICPVKWVIYAIEGALRRGFSVMELMKPCTILLAVGAACFALGLYFMKRKPVSTG